MRVYTVVLVLTVAPAVLAGYFQYFDNFKNINDEDVIDCMVKEKIDSCSDILREIKDKFDDILATNCGECDVEEREEFMKYAAGFTHRHADVSKMILDRYDPERKYEKKYGETWAEKGIALL
ncbi:ejaculatory bulb-specific protein 3-like [Schistocerca gregaria]|uniref:ejaculatory bulb-specific protein 3-like n=1 Tax=Schistocerca gregaria TaxID=7010 RepID=UPI00211E8EF5|nr:ejaculatory bulb-specific protein 3-like [Schistocerca gregaria]